MAAVYDYRNFCLIKNASKSENKLLVLLQSELEPVGALNIEHYTAVCYIVQRKVAEQLLRLYHRVRVSLGVHISVCSIVSSLPRVLDIIYSGKPERSISALLPPCFNSGVLEACILEAGEGVDRYFALRPADIEPVVAGQSGIALCREKVPRLLVHNTSAGFFGMPGLLELRQCIYRGGVEFTRDGDWKSIYTKRVLKSSNEQLVVVGVGGVFCADKRYGFDKRRPGVNI